MDPERCYLSWTLSLETDRPAEDIESVFEFVKDDGVLTIEEHSDVSPLDGETSVTPAGASFLRHPRESGEPSSQTVLDSHFRGNDATGRIPAFAGTTAEGKGEGDSASPQRLGEILVAEGLVAPETLAGALSQQKRLGEILVEQKVVTPRQVAQALDKQSQEKAAAGRKVESASIRVDTEKIDKLINLVGELVITQSMLSDLSSRFEVEQLPVLRERVAQLEHNTRELQERIMSIRMLPIGTAFNRFPRLVRDLAAHNGKKIQLVLSGEETELDKTVIESIGDPLTHLVRNSADHGLESPEARLAAGKPEQGTIRLNAFHEGGNICITVEDDGRGLNREKILAKAVTQGLIAESDRLTDDQVWALIFRPGFSTADTITDVSGRGVGMDVVKRNIDRLGGTVSIRTAPGRGATFTLKLPLTLAIIEGMTVRVGPELYIVPLVSIVESVQPKPGAVKTIVERGEVVNVRGHYVPVIRLADVFGIASDITDPSKGILVILETEGEQVAVLVDELVGQQQVVVKSLEQNFQKVDGFAGATILGDGTVGFILDVRGLLDLARRGEAVGA
jgi:two-component system chemotaxis sensor kinase CheA